MVRSFLSYQHKDKQLAGTLKKKLAGYGFDSFLAHEDIKPSKEWQEEILRQLAACEVFVALLTKAFDRSDWTHQEIGIAFSRGAVRPIMMPINAGSKPVGFLARFQDIKLDPNRLAEKHRPSWGSKDFRLSYLDTLCLHIVKSIAEENTQIAGEIRNSLIEKLETTVETYDRAGLIMWKLAEINGLTSIEINRVLEIATTNNQIHEAGSASGHIGSLIDKHKNGIKKRVLREFRKVWKYK